MRYQKAEEVLQCALMMQSSRLGITLVQIAEAFGISHRTAQRLRDAVTRTFPQVEERTAEGGVKTHHLPPGTLDGLISVSADEMADLESAINCLKQCNRTAQAHSLEQMRDKLRAKMPGHSLSRIEPDISALLEAEGLAHRPLPRLKIDNDILLTLRHAIKACRKVILTYRNRSGNRAQHDVLPYGFLYGIRHYLICKMARESKHPYKMYSLSDIAVVEETSEPFIRDESFSLADYAEQSFGTWHGDEPAEVAWKFDATAAPKAKEFIFHPKQIVEECEDGSIIVRFTAGGFMEMAWHLYIWGRHVEVLSPLTLADMVNSYQRQWDGLP